MLLAPGSGHLPSLGAAVVTCCCSLILDIIPGLLLPVSQLLLLLAPGHLPSQGAAVPMHPHLAPPSIQRLSVEKCAAECGTVVFLMQAKCGTAMEKCAAKCGKVCSEVWSSSISHASRPLSTALWEDQAFKGAEYRYRSGTRMQSSTQPRV